MKVMLINSLPKDGAYATSDWDTAQEDIGAFPPIGLSYLAGYLVERTHHEVVILDAVAERMDYPQIHERILKFKPDIVGVQHVRMFSGETLKHPEIDFLVRGEGEIIFANLLDALEKGKPLIEVE